jgi:hypothetical protein
LLIILEGADCAGKSTLAGRLLTAIRHAEPNADVRYLHSGPPVEHPLTEYVEPLLDYRPGTDVHYVLDRWHVGESVYPQVLGRDTDMTEDVRLYVELFLRSRGALLVYCTADRRLLEACGRARGDADDEVRRVVATRDAFDRVVTRSLLPNLAVDVSDPDRSNYHDAVENVLDAAEWHDRDARPLSPYVTYVGPPRPSLLLVGDRRGTPSHDVREFGSWPAFSPVPGTSGSYLLTTLVMDELTVPTHGLTLRDVGVVNACDVDDVGNLWRTLGRPDAVGLGVNARRELRSAHVQHRSATHPQYQRRFRHHDRRAYLETLLNVQRSTVTA